MSAQKRLALEENLISKSFNACMQHTAISALNVYYCSMAVCILTNLPILKMQLYTCGTLGQAPT